MASPDQQSHVSAHREITGLAHGGCFHLSRGGIRALGVALAHGPTAPRARRVRWNVENATVAGAIPTTTGRHG